jgi:hypothetical protein
MKGFESERFEPEQIFAKAQSKIKEQIALIQQIQEKIAVWEAEIERNKIAIQLNQNQALKSVSLIAESAAFMKINDTLQGWILDAYANEVEPLQNGVLLLRELCIKTKEETSFSELKEWADVYLSDFLRANPKVAKEGILNFRKLASIPLQE